MNILIIGGGGREHALAWKVAKSEHAERVFVAPGNAGTALESKTDNVAIAATDIPALVNFAQRQRVGLTIVGPEAPLVAGLVDAFSSAGLRCYGPTREAASLEGSKAFMKAFLARHGIPTGAYETFRDTASAADYLRGARGPLVVKADGLAGGKGVSVVSTGDEALAVVHRMLSGEAFGDAGKQVVIEEYLEGEEASFIVLVDGEHVLPLASSQDHKARDDGDNGPNTGGMGAYSPAPVVTDLLHARIMHEVILPVVTGMAEEGRPYQGFLYAGLMVASDGTPRVLEFNCRCGDPEAQPILMRLGSDLVELCHAGVDGSLDQAHAHWDARVALGVVMAAAGYPERYPSGEPIRGLDQELEDTKVFHAGTKSEKGKVVTAGGRVLCVTALGESVAAASRRAYERVETISWPHLHYRRDIGHRAIAR
jgi:phosphoribosylamine--glycine ligase